MENITATGNSSETQYAGFWLRFVAWLVDALILKIVHWVLFTPLFIFVGLSTYVKGYDFDLENFDFAEAFPLVLAILAASTITFIFSITVRWLYYAIMESSSKQATIGKMLLNLKVIDVNGGRVSFAQASARYFGKIISFLIAGVGYIMAGVSSKKQALHDMMSNCLIVKK